MPHKWNYDIESLRQQVAATIAMFKLEKERLHKLQLKDADELEFSDRNVIMNWSRASIADFNEKLDDMEEITKPSAEERQVMQQLTELIFLGDQIADVQGEVGKRLDAKFGKVKWMFTSDLPEGAYLREDGKMVIPRKSQQGPKALVVQPSPKPAGTPLITTKPAFATIEDATEDQPSGHATPSRAYTNLPTTGGRSQKSGDSDPEGIYTMLGLTPEASMEQIKKAARRKQVTLHPDKNKDDPNASMKFAEFMTLYRETLSDEEKRQAYDNIKPSELAELSKRVRELTVGNAPTT